MDEEILAKAEETKKGFQAMAILREPNPKVTAKPDDLFYELAKLAEEKGYILSEVRMITKPAPHAPYSAKIYSEHCIRRQMARDRTLCPSTLEAITGA